MTAVSKGPRCLCACKLWMFIWGPDAERGLKEKQNISLSISEACRLAESLTLPIDTTHPVKLNLTAATSGLSAMAQATE
jgi:hypothetical protein